MSTGFLGRVGEERVEGGPTDAIVRWRGEGSGLQAGQHDIKLRESAAPRRHPRVPPFWNTPYQGLASLWNYHKSSAVYA
jgi:hypothetical protein